MAKMEIGRQKFQPQFLVRLARGTGIGRFPFLRVQFAAARTPEPAIRLLRAFKQEDFIALIEAIEQRRDFVRQLHVRSETIATQRAKHFVSTTKKRKNPDLAIRALKYL
jgi:hypothetical protein